MSAKSSVTLNFTKNSLGNIPIPLDKKQSIYYDTQIKGLIVMVFQSGRKTFYLSKKINGKAIKYKLGTYPDMSIENARKTAQSTLSEIALGGNPQETKRSISKEITLGNYFMVYLDEHAKPHKKSWRLDEYQFDRYLSDWKLKKLNSITMQDVRKKHADIGTEHGIYTANRLVALLSTIYNKAIKDGVTKTVNPVTGVKKFKEKSRDRFLQPEELKYFWEAVFQESNVTIRDFVMILLFTGARRSNVQAMRWEQINFDRGEWRILDTKNGEPLTLPLSPSAIEILKARKNQAKDKKKAFNVWVFEGTGKKGYLQDPKRAWWRINQRAEIFQLIELIAKHEKWADKKIIDKKLAIEENITLALENYHTIANKLKLDTNNVGLGDLRIHDLRRTLGSWQAATGANSFIIGKSLGHKSHEATAVYARLNLDPVRQSVNIATEAMLKAAQVKNL